MVFICPGATDCKLTMDARNPRMRQKRVQRGRFALIARRPPPRTG